MPLLATRRQQPRAGAQGSGFVHDFYGRLAQRDAVLARSSSARRE